jgi:hypothetical protein
LYTKPFYNVTAHRATYAGAIRHPDPAIDFNLPLPFLLPPNDGVPDDGVPDNGIPNDSIPDDNIPDDNSVPDNNDGVPDNNGYQSNNDDVIHPPNARKPPGRPGKRRVRPKRWCQKRDVKCIAVAVGELVTMKVCATRGFDQFDG